MKPTSRTSSWLWATGLGLAALATTVWRNRRGSYELAGRTVLITGGSRGLGLVLARRAVAEGARVAICARDEQELARARQDLLRYGGSESTVLALSRDLTDAADPTDLTGSPEESADVVDREAPAVDPAAATDQDLEATQPVDQPVERPAAEADDAAAAGRAPVAPYGMVAG